MISLAGGFFGAAVLTAALGSCAGQDAESLAATGLELAKQQDLAGALDHFEAALQADPQNIKALYNGGLADLYLRRGTSASKRFEAFTRLRPNDSLGHFNLARAYALSLRREEALTALHRAVELGFDRHDELMGGGFESIEDDLRFAQIEVLVAQRAGVGAAVGAGFEGTSLNGGSAYGGQRMKSTKLPGRGARINARCVGPTAPPAVAGVEVDFAAECQ